MAGSLISLLQKHQGKSPDEIAKALKAPGWIKGSDMTQDQYDHLSTYGSHIYIINWSPGNNNWYHNGGIFNMNSWSLASVNRDLANYYFIPTQERDPDVFPDR